MISKIILQFKSIIKKSSSGNFALITAFLIPFIFAAVGISIDVARIMYNKNLIQLSSDEALEQGLDTLISNNQNNKYTTETIKTFIKNDFKIKLMNGFNDTEATDIANKAQITIEQTSSGYSAKLISSYNMLVNPFSAINLSKDRSVPLNITSIITRASKKNDTFIVMANPELWVTHYPQTSVTEWTKRNNLMINSFNTLANTKNIAFAIINGNMTSMFYFDDDPMNFDTVYNALPFKSMIGLGENDYSFYYDFRLLKHTLTHLNLFNNLINKYQNTLPLFSQDLYRNITNTVFKYSGTMDYSWDYQDLHFIQMHNSPFYEKYFHISLNNKLYDIYIYYIIADGMISPWLENDLKTATQRNKKIFLTMYDADLRSANNVATTGQKQNMQNIIQKYKIKAIFSGSAHQQQETFSSSLYNSVRIYNAGEASQGDYLVLERINDNTLSVTAYNGASGNPVVVKKMSDINLQ
ncbi:hypothetical protein B488_03950 [Liberibacter crescens BT-1]|uniref:Uncharacterized protein n=1 Tax=Liberibacter crescens (strain BT-1) TaxID=1215343 RepID=L0ETU4_LIBCB|nr:hypothetical protein [Liberibacter crescens]AGA64387.1 hypothetical protein B488_03950 [Liberibacter crescens BT-1]AMC12573.1 hypothetical protein RL73_02120 [Liberibacter crescens]